MDGLPNEVILRIFRHITKLYSTEKSNLPLEDRILKAKQQLFQLCLVCKRFDSIAALALRTYFILDFQHLVTLKFRSLQYRTMHPMFATGTATGTNSSQLLIDEYTVSLSCAHSTEIQVDYQPDGCNFIQFPTSVDSACELSMYFPFNRELNERVYRFDLSGSTAGIHYIMDPECCLKYELIKDTIRQERQIIKADGVQSIPVSTTRYRVRIDRLTITHEGIGPGERRLELDKELSNICYNTSHELILAYLHGPECSREQLAQLGEIVRMFNGLPDKRFLLHQHLIKTKHDINIYEYPELKRFILSNSNYVKHIPGDHKFIKVLENKAVIEWNGIYSLVTQEMVHLNMNQHLDALVNNALGIN